MLPIRPQFILIAMLLTLASASAIAEPQVAKPAAGPAPGNQNINANKNAAQTEEDRNHQLYIDAVLARDRADLKRSDFESKNRDGPVAKTATVEFEQVVAAYQEAINRPVSSPEIRNVVLYCYLRLAGAFQHVQQFDKAIEQATKAANQFAGTPEEVEATMAVGLIYLQAVHDPNKAIEWLKKSQELAQAIDVPEQKAKWLSATAESLRRAEKELAKP